MEPTNQTANPASNQHLSALPMRTRLKAFQGVACMRLSLKKKTCRAGNLFRKKMWFLKSSLPKWTFIWHAFDLGSWDTSRRGRKEISENRWIKPETSEQVRNVSDRSLFFPENKNRTAVTNLGNKPGVQELLCNISLANRHCLCWESKIWQHVLAPRQRFHIDS